MTQKAHIRNVHIIALLAGLAAMLLASGCTGTTTPPAAPPANQTTQPQAAPSDFSIKYTSEGGFDPHREIITISPSGDYKFEYQTLGGKVTESYTGKLTAQEMNQLYNFTVNDNKFFSLPGELGKGQCADGMSTYIEIQANGKTHTSGHSSIACEIDNANFKNVAQEIRLRTFKLPRKLDI